MKKLSKPDPLAERPNIDFSKGVRGKYTNQLPEGTNLAIIDPELHTHFPDSDSVNRALRALLTIRESISAATSAQSGRQSKAA